MKGLIISVFIALFALLTGCGQGYKTHKTVEDFLENQMQLTQYKTIEWGKIDSTFRISSDVLAVLRRQGKIQFKRDFSYCVPSAKLNFLTVKYVRDANIKDTVSQTFYINDQLTGVVAFKQN